MIDWKLSLAFPRDAFGAQQEIQGLGKKAFGMSLIFQVSSPQMAWHSHLGSQPPTESQLPRQG